MKIKAIDISVLLTLIICIIATLSFENNCEGIRQQVLRLHIIANSDTADDQQLKNFVRNEVLTRSEVVFARDEDILSAQSSASENIGVFLEAAREVIAKEGFDYDVTAEVRRCYFPTRVYDNVTLPAGYYKALRIIIGEGKGKNWWCIMFPPLCLPAAADNKAILENHLGEKEMKIVTSSPDYEVRFWIIEKYYEIKEKYFGENK